MPNGAGALHPRVARVVAVVVAVGVAAVLSHAQQTLQRSGCCSCFDFSSVTNG